MKDHKLIKANAGYLSVQKKPTQRDLEEYYKKTYFQGEEGKKVHLARVQIENLLNKSHNNEINLFYSQLAKIGMVRDLTVFISSKR